MSEKEPISDAPSSSEPPKPVAPTTATTANERVDEDGLPLDRPATLDDVRGDAGSGRSIAIGCTIVVALVLGLFWLIRGGLLR